MLLPPLIFKLKASLSGMGVISGLYTRAEREVAREIDLFDAARCIVLSAASHGGIARNFMEYMIHSLSRLLSRLSLYRENDRGR